MAERSDELNNVDKLDRVPTAGARNDISMKKYADNYLETGSEDMNLAVMTDDTHEETELIKAQIEETRSQMGDTIDAIQERLSFSNISEQVSEQVSHVIETAKDSVYDATIGKAVNYMKNTGNEISRSSLVTAARENPLPFVLIGLGTGLLLYNSYGKKNYRTLNRYRANYRTGYENADPADHAGSSTEESRRSLYASAQEKIGDVKSSVSNAAGTAYDSVTNAAGSTYSGALDLTNRAYEKAGEFGTVARDTYDQYLEEKPWAIGAIALVAGAAVGLAIPSTRYEGELMGEARHNLLSKAQESASDLVDKAKQVANEAGRTITEEAKNLTQDRH